MLSKIKKKIDQLREKILHGAAYVEDTTTPPTSQRGVVYLLSGKRKISATSNI